MTCFLLSGLLFQEPQDWLWLFRLSGMSCWSPTLEYCRDKTGFLEVILAPSLAPSS